jgi:hypothetical protein
MRKLTKLGVAVVLTAAVAISLKFTVLNGAVQAGPETAAGVSPYRLHLQTDTKRLPVLEIADLI